MEKPSAVLEKAHKDSKRNLVNTYVWSADNGVFIESEQSLSTWEETFASQLNFDSSYGINTDISLVAGGLSVGGSANVLFGYHLQNQLSKSQSVSRGLGIDLKNNCEGILGWYNPLSQDYDYDAKGMTIPSVPGKVNGYRFKTFYLAPTNDAFNHFFDTVVDPKWLQEDDSPEAKAIREARGNATQTWRLFHRVPYVSRVPGATKIPVESIKTKISAINPEANQLVIGHLSGRRHHSEKYDKEIDNLLNDYKNFFSEDDRDHLKKNISTYWEAYNEAQKENTTKPEE